MSGDDEALVDAAGLIAMPETKIYNIENDKFETVSAYVPNSTLSYTCEHTFGNPFFDVVDTTGSPSEGSGLTLRLTLDTADPNAAWECKPISIGSGYAESDTVKVYGNITGLNVLLAREIAGCADATAVTAYLKGGEQIKRLQTIDSHWGGAYSNIKKGEGGECRVSDTGESELTTVLAGKDRTTYTKSGFHNMFNRTGSDIATSQFKHVYTTEVARGWVGFGSGVGVLSRVLGTQEARRFRETAEKDYSKDIMGPLDGILQSIKVKSLGRLGSIGNAARGHKGAYLQDPSFFDDVKFKRFAGAVSDAASFAAHVRPLISDEHVAAVSAHLAQLPSGSIVRPKYIKDFIRKL